MLHHTVHFWLKPGITDDRKAAMIQGLKDLSKSPNVSSTWVGTPAGTPRDIVDNSYAIQLLAVFADKTAQAAYQSEDDAVHMGFVAEFKDDWEKVLVYDSVGA